MAEPKLPRTALYAVVERGYSVTEPRGPKDLDTPPASSQRRAEVSALYECQKLCSFGFHQSLIPTTFDIKPHNRLRVRHPQVETPVAKIDGDAVGMINLAL